MIYRPVNGQQMQNTAPVGNAIQPPRNSLPYRPPTGRPMPPGTPGFPGGSISPLPIGGGGYQSPGGGKWPWEQGGAQQEKPNPWDNMGDQTRAKYERWKNNQRKDPWTGEAIGDVSEKAYYQFLNPPQNVALGGGYQSPGGQVAQARSEGPPAQGQKVINPPTGGNVVGLPPQYQSYQRPQFQNQLR